MRACGVVTMSKISMGDQQSVPGLAFALCCARENKIRHFAAAEKNSLCYPAFRRAEYFTFSNILIFLWRLETVTGNYF